jgi:hypothetical protein
MHMNGSNRQLTSLNDYDAGPRFAVFEGWEPQSWMRSRLSTSLRGMIRFANRPASVGMTRRREIEKRGRAAL